MRIAATAAAGEADALGPAEAALSREAIARWSGVACLYAGTAAALACLWSPV
jgi:hypothetical protein